MIKKIVSLNGIGRFEAFKAHGDVEFKKYTLIFAENGVGKTTLCEVIRSLQTDNPDIIKGRRTLGAGIEPEAKVLLGDGAFVEFKNGAWSRTPPGGVAIFDASYVRDNVHAGEVVDTTHKRNLFQVIVGAEGVRLSKLVSSLEKQRSDLNTPIRDAKRAIDGAVPVGMTFDQYLAFAEDEDIEAKVAKAETDLAAAKKSNEIKQHKVLSVLTVPLVPGNFLGTLGTTLDDIADESEEILRKHLAHLGGKEAQTWLSSGTAMITDDKCPFCQQDIISNDLVAAYRACFSEGYRALAMNVGALSALLIATFGEVSAGKLDTTVAANVETIAWWKDYAAIAELPTPNLIVANEAYAEVLRLAAEHVSRKQTNLLDAIGPSAELNAAFDELQATIDEIKDYNLAVGAGNAALEARKAELDNVDAPAADRALKKLQACKNRNEMPMAGACQDYLALTNQREVLGTQKDQAKALLDEYTEKVVGIYEKALNSYLKKFMVGFKIQGTRAEFPRGLPSSNYQLVINDVEIDIGNDESPDSEPTFKNTLSGGDRSALALALFMAQLDHSPDKAEIAVVLDDPFQSQDGFRRNATAFQIKRAGDNAKQIIVMSHDAYFLKLVWDELPLDQRKALRLNAVGNTSTMSEWDIYEHLRSDHQHNITALQRYIDDGKGAPRDVAQKLRPALEGYCKIVAYGEFGEGVMMGEIIGSVRDAGVDHVLHNVLDRLEELNSYARRYHHATNVDAAIEPLNEGELQGYTRQILELMRVKPSPAK